MSESFSYSSNIVHQLHILAQKGVTSNIKWDAVSCMKWDKRKECDSKFLE